MSAPRYFVNITDGEGTLLARIDITGTDLRRQAARVWLGEAVQEGMGGEAVTLCAQAEEPEA